MKTFKEFIFEDGEALGAAGGVTNSVGSGAIAGVGIGRQGEPGVLKKDKTKSKKIKSCFLVITLKC